MTWKDAQRAGKSLAGWIATSPRLALIIFVLLTVLLSSAAAFMAKRSTERTLIAEMQRQAEKYAILMEEKEVEFQRAMAPLIRERNRLRMKLSLYENAPKPVPPRSDEELIERLKRLGY